MPTSLIQRETEQCNPDNLSVFPLDQSALKRLATTLDADQLKQSRLTMFSAMTALLETTFKEIETMEALATQLVLTHPDLVRDVAIIRKSVTQLYAVLGDKLSPA